MPSARRFGRLCILYARRFGGVLGAKTEPKSILKRCKIAVDFQERKNTLQDRCGILLGILLVRFQVDLEGQIRAVARAGLVFWKITVFDQDKLSRRDSERSCGDLGTQEHPKGSPRRSQKDSQTTCVSTLILDRRVHANFGVPRVCGLSATASN